MTDSRAIVEGPVPGDPFFVGSGIQLDAAGYVGEEWFLSGTACGYSLTGAQDERGEDGRWQAQRTAGAPFKTRILVRRPQDPARFNGTVVVEWFNVTAGLDVGPGWFFLHRHLMREGTAWVGVSAQKAGIDGGGLVPGMPLKKANAERYGVLSHPGDAFAFDIYSAVARALRSPESSLLGPLFPRRVIAIGESQSAGYLVSYANAVDPLEQCFDAFLIHGRPGRSAELDGSYIREARDGNVSDVSRVASQGHRIREDVRVPVLIFQSETDVVTLGGSRARQPDSERFRLWELAGASHFDTYGLIATHVDREGVAIEELASRMAPTTNAVGMPSDSPVNSGPQQHYVLGAALSHLDRWVREGAPPPEAPRLKTTDDIPAVILRDDLGIARGGIRTPWVEAPSAVLSGDPPGGDGFTFLFGKTVALDNATLARLYPGGPEEHRKLFEVATEKSVREGFLLEADADEICALARHGRQPSGWRSE